MSHSTLSRETISHPHPVFMPKVIMYSVLCKIEVWGFTGFLRLLIDFCPFPHKMTTSQSTLIPECTDADKSASVISGSNEGSVFGRKGRCNKAFGKKSSVVNTAHC